MGGRARRLVGARRRYETRLRLHWRLSGGPPCPMFGLDRHHGGAARQPRLSRLRHSVACLEEERCRFGAPAMPQRASSTTCRCGTASRSTRAPGLQLGHPSRSTMALPETVVGLVHRPSKSEIPPLGQPPGAAPAHAPAPASPSPPRCPLPLHGCLSDAGHEPVQPGHARRQDPAPAASAPPLGTRRWEPRTVVHTGRRGQCFSPSSASGEVPVAVRRLAGLGDLLEAGSGPGSGKPSGTRRRPLPPVSRGSL